MSRLCPGSDRLRRTDAAKVTVRGPDLFGQGRVLSANKTARRSHRVFVPSSTVVPVLNAFGLFAHTNEIRARQASNAAYALAVGSLRHFIGVRVGDEHLAHLQALEEASGLSRGSCSTSSPASTAWR